MSISRSELDRLAEINKQLSHLETAAEKDELADELEDEKAALLSNLIEDLGRLIDPLERRVMLLRYGKGLLWKEVAAAIGYSQTAAFAIHQSALRKLLER